MKLAGKLKKGPNIVKEGIVEKGDDKLSFTDRLEACLIELCRQMDIPVPLWLDKNTREFVSFHRTFFSKEQFVEKVRFDVFEIRMEQ